MYFENMILKYMGKYNGDKRMYEAPNTPMKFLSFDPNDDSELKDTEI